MGAVNSCCIPHHSHHDGPKCNRSKFKGHRRNLSATFNMSVADDDAESHSLVNINSATEEELMTLPGISRSVAASIVDYRRQIGGFRRVEDLALVSGVGADRLSRIRCDITTGLRTNPGSRDSSLRGSRGAEGDSAGGVVGGGERNGRGGGGGGGGGGVGGSGGSSRSALVINVNTANIFQLIKIKGVGMGLAENIVTYREKNGPYKSLDDLLRVKGIGAGILGAIRPYLSLDSSSLTSSASATSADNSNHHHLHPSSSSPTSPNSLSLNPATSPSTTTNGKLPNKGAVNGDARSPSSGSSLPHMSPYQRRSTASMENLLQALGPMAEVPKRRALTQTFKFRHKNRRVVRVASWNLEQCSLDKVSNPGVKDVVCMTILENGFGIVAVQELSHDKALEEICQELNEPTLPNVKNWSGHRGRWKCAVSDVAGRMFRAAEYNGFLYDSSQKVELLSASLLERGEDNGRRPFARMPYMGFFKVNGQLDCVVVSVHLKATGLGGEDLQRTQAEVATMADVLDCVSTRVPDEKDIIFVGDFNLGPDSHAFERLKSRGYLNMIPEDTPTNISSSNPGGSHCYDNIWLSPNTQQVHTGNKGVVREGLSSPWIPNGWSWGGVVSDYCPVYTELYTNQDLDRGDLSIGAEDIRFILGADSG